jgi:hypothetical protein
MGSISNMILIFNRSTTCKVMNEFIVLKFKKQHTNLLFILHSILIRWRFHFCWSLFQPQILL